MNYILVEEIKMKNTKKVVFQTPPIAPSRCLYSNTSTGVWLSEIILSSCFSYTERMSMELGYDDRWAGGGSYYRYFNYFNFLNLL